LQLLTLCVLSSFNYFAIINHSREKETSLLFIKVQQVWISVMDSVREWSKHQKCKLRYAQLLQLTAVASNPPVRDFGFFHLNEAIHLAEGTWVVLPKYPLVPEIMHGESYVVDNVRKSPNYRDSVGAT
jgi:hypothetical protein